MKIIRNFGRNWKMRYGEAVGSRLRSVADKVGMRFRFREKIESMNLWAKENPRRFFRRVNWAAAAVLVAGLAMIATSGPRGTESGVTMDDTVDEIHQTSSLIDRMRTRYSRKAEERQLFDELLAEANNLKREMDSICGKNAMTRNDTLQVIQRQKQLEIIINTLRPDEKN